MIKKVTSKFIGKLTVLQKQIITAVILGAVLIMIIAFILAQISANPAISKEKEKKADENSMSHTTQVETVGDKINAQESWRYTMQAQQKKIENEVDVIKEALVKGLNEQKKGEVSPEILHLQNEIERLKAQIIKAPSLPRGESGPESRNLSIKKIKINLANKPEESLKTKDDTIAAGAFARAVLLAGVDASVALNSSSDPRPLLIRLVDHGTLPRKFKSDLKDCHIVASGYGDLSSERVFVRLEKLTCAARSTGEIIETEVAGYVTGEDGRAGIKGEVIEKGRGYLAKSVVGGMLQGVAGVLQESPSTFVNPMGTLTGGKTTKNKINEGMTSGVGGSMDRLSKYYIDRAESIQPVIQVDSGRVVDVIFTEGGSIGSRDISKKLESNQQKIQTQKKQESSNEW